MLTIVNKIYRKEVYILSVNVENYRTILTLFYILYSTKPMVFFPIMIFNKLKEKPHVTHNSSLHLRSQ